MIRMQIVAATICLVLVVGWATTSKAGPTVLLGRSVPAGEQVPVDQIDHSAWTVLLAKHCDTQGYVNYSGWKASAADQDAISRYIDHLSSAAFPANASREAKLAFWINAYNAVTVKGILREYPTTSIRNHTAKIYGYNIWKDLQLVVGGKPYSLDAMEHEVLRKMGEPRIHFAIVCASIGCPRLLNEAFVLSRLDEQLSRNAKAFFADKTKFVANPQARTIQVSPILSWFGTDFGPDVAAQMRAIAPYVPEAAQALTNSGQARVTYLEYDWGLNDKAKARGSSPR